MDPQEYQWLHSSPSTRIQTLEDQLNGLNLSPSHLQVASTDANPWLPPSASASGLGSGWASGFQRPSYESVLPSSNNFNVERLRAFMAARAQVINNAGSLSDAWMREQASYGDAGTNMRRRAVSCSEIAANEAMVQLLAARNGLGLGSNGGVGHDSFDLGRRRLSGGIDYGNSSRANPYLGSCLYNNIENHLEYTRNSVEHNRARGGKSHRSRHSINSSIASTMDCPPMDELRGRVASFAVDQQRSRILQRMLEEGNEDELKLIVAEVKEDLSEIVMTQAGSHFFQKLSGFCDVQDLTELLRVAMASADCFLNICMDNHGTRAMQKLVNALGDNNVEQKSIILSILSEVTVPLTLNVNGYHFIQELFTDFQKAPDIILPLLEEINDHCLDVAVDKYGCCVLQHALRKVSQGDEHQRIQNVYEEAARNRILQKIVTHVLELSEDNYGNFVVQYVIGMKDQFSIDLIQRLHGNFAELCKNKYASHVVEKCFREGSPEQLKLIVKELIEDPNFLDILKHPIGNYVPQKALKPLKDLHGSNHPGSLFNTMVERIIDNYAFLHSHPFGKKVLSKAKNAARGIEDDY